MLPEFSLDNGEYLILPLFIKLFYFILFYFIFLFIYYNFDNIIGDWGLGIGDWAQSPIPNPHSIFIKNFKLNFKIIIIY